MKLTSAQDAIKQAIQGGYDFSGIANATKITWSPLGGERVQWESGPRMTTSKIYIAFLLEPQFWQALGKARGWTTITDFEGEVGAWMGYAREWFETRLSGGDEKKFWESLP
jgi:hypothetical protein